MPGRSSASVAVLLAAADEAWREFTAREEGGRGAWVGGGGGGGGGGVCRWGGGGVREWGPCVMDGRLRGGFGRI